MSFIDVERDLRRLRKPEHAKQLARFFKTGKGEYAEGDQFYGITVPVLRRLVRQYLATLTLKDARVLLASPIHEARFVALVMMGEWFVGGDERMRQRILKMYLASTRYINNWDLVDVSAYRIVGPWIHNDPSLVRDLARSSSLWERRIAIVSTFYEMKQGRSALVYELAETLLDDPHDLIHKAVGWMLRECGKRVSEKELVQFIHAHIRRMPRTMLRYAIERFSPKTRRMFLAL